MSDTIKIAFCGSNKLGALAIKLFTVSKFAHCALVMPDGETVIESTAKHGGVNLSTLTELKKINEYVEVCPYFVEHPNLAYDFAKSQIGKGYDFKYIFSFIISREWQDQTKWACSELVYASLMAGGRRIFRDEFKERITPGDLYKIAC